MFHVYYYTTYIIEPSCSIKSRRNLNHWGFVLVKGVNHPDYQCYFHKHFLRTKRDLCSKIKRVHDISSDEAPAELTSSPSYVSLPPSRSMPFFSEPNFYEMEWLPSSQQEEESCNQEQTTNTDDISSSTANVSNSTTHSSHHSSSTSENNKIIIGNCSSNSEDYVSTSINIPWTRNNQEISKEAEWKTPFDDTFTKFNSSQEQSVENVAPLHFASSAQCSTHDEQKPDSSVTLEVIQEFQKLDSSSIHQTFEKYMIGGYILSTDHTSHNSIQENRPNRPDTPSRNCIQEKGKESKEPTNILQNLPPAIDIHTNYAGNKSSDINQVLTSTNEIKTPLPSLGIKRKRTDDFWDERDWEEFLLEQYFLLPHDLPKLCTVFETT